MGGDWLRALYFPTYTYAVRRALGCVNYKKIHQVLYFRQHWRNIQNKSRKKEGFLTIWLGNKENTVVSYLYY